MTAPTISSFVPTWSWLSEWHDVRYVKTTSTSTSSFYQIVSYDTSGVVNSPAWMDTRYQMEFRYDSTAIGLTKIFCNTNNHIYDDIPFTFANGVVSQNINVGDTVSAYQGNGSIAFTFTVTSGMLWSSPPNTNSVSDAVVSYVVEDNELRIFIPSDKPSSWDPNLNPSGRNLYYQLRKVSGTNFWTRFYHIIGFPTNETIVPTTAGIYQLEKVLTNPLDYFTYNTVEVTQAQLDFYATNNPPDDDPPENDPPPTPVFVPRSARRGNLNFW